MSRAILTTLYLLFLPEMVWAHYYWVTVDSSQGDHGTANIYFEEGPRQGDGKYLDPFIKRGKTWIRTVVNDASVNPIAVVDVNKSGKRYLSAALKAGGPRSIDSYGKWGVYRYGKTDVLLHYNARYIDVESADQLRLLARSKKLALDLVPRLSKDNVEIQVQWNGKPVPQRPLFVRGVGGFKKNLTTDEAGNARFSPKIRGLYTFRTNVEEKERTGEFEGKHYDLIRHHCTLLLRLPISSE